MRRYVDRIGAIVSQPSSVLVTRSEAVKTELRRSFPQPRLKGLRGLIVPSHVPQEKVRAKRTPGVGTELIYQSTVGAIRRRFVRIPDSLLIDRNGQGVRKLVKTSWTKAERDGFTVAFLSFQHGKDSSMSALVGDTTGLKRLAAKATEIATASGHYRDPEKWFRGITFIAEAGGRRAPIRAGGMKRTRARQGLAKRRSKTKANLLLKG